MFEMVVRFLWGSAVEPVNSTEDMSTGCAGTLAAKPWPAIALKGARPGPAKLGARRIAGC
jgi:hypothetical protein